MQLFSADAMVFSKKFKKIFWKHYSVRTEKLHNNFIKKIFEIFLGGPKKWKNQFFLGLKMPL